MSVENFIYCIENKKPISFSKYGDGEYLCADSEIHKIQNMQFTQNCDGDNFTKSLSESLKKSFVYMVENGENAFLGKWHDIDVVKYWESLTNNKVNWANYHSLLLYDGDINIINIYKSIKKATQKKIYICNELLIKSKILLNIDHIVIIPLNNWFDTEFDKVLKKIIHLIGKKDGNHIVMTSCGMSAKVLICELYKLYPKGIYLDIGSGLDTICTKRSTRGMIFDYIISYSLFKELIPENWDDTIYDDIYIKANDKLGLHLPKL